MTAILTDRRNTIMTRRAVSDYTGMIEDRAAETGCAMANTAILGGDDMSRRLRKSADRIVGPIVARGTITADTRMIEYRW